MILMIMKIIMMMMMMMKMMMMIIIIIIIIIIIRNGERGSVEKKSGNNVAIDGLANAVKKAKLGLTN